MSDVPVLILAGGKGLRMREYTESIPKALVRIGDIPVVLHVMNIYAKYGYKRFVLSIGYMGQLIREFFEANSPASYDITCVDTGLETQTGGRIKLAEKYLDEDDFFATYCDGVSDINLSALYNYHKQRDTLATLTAVHPLSTFGILAIENDGIVSAFKEKPFLKDYINGGFFVFKNGILDSLKTEDILEEQPMKNLVQRKQLSAFKHEGFWACMDTFKDVERLNNLWYKGEMTNTGYKGKAPWV